MAAEIELEFLATQDGRRWVPDDWAVQAWCDAFGEGIKQGEETGQTYGYGVGFEDGWEKGHRAAKNDH